MDWMKPLRHFPVRLVVGMLLLNLVVVAAAIYFIVGDRQEHENRARVAVRNVALLTERDTSAVFERIDLTLHNVVEEVEEHLHAGQFDAARLRNFLRYQREHLPEIMELQVTDAKGVVRIGSGDTPASAIDLSDREHFKRQRDDPRSGLVIAKPAPGSVTHEWVVSVSRRVKQPGGEFAGVVYANIPLEYFVHKFSELNLGKRGVVGLHTADHGLMARYPQSREPDKGMLPDPLRHLLASGAASGTYVASSPVDSIERLVAFQKGVNYPYYVLVGHATEDYLGEWIEDVAGTALAVLIFSPMSFVFAWLIWRSWRSQLAAAEALRGSEERLRFALDGAGYCLWDWDLRSSKFAMSQRGKQMLGLRDEEIGGDIGDWIERVHPDDRPVLRAELRKYLRGQLPDRPAEVRLRHKYGNWVWVLTRAMVTNRDEQGKVSNMIGTLVDMTERHERMDALRLAATVFEISDEAVVVTNAQNEIISVNPAFTTITGYTLQDVLGRNPRMFSAKSQPKEFYAEMWRSLTETGSWRGEVTNRKKSGEVYVEWLSLKCVFDGKGRLTHHVALFSDITARKAAERRIQHLALHDGLTNLPNRILLSERLSQAIMLAQRERSRLALMYLDLDRFKPVNDEFGHEVGDQLLQAVSERVRDCLRASDTLARIGGDEFVVLLPKMDTVQDASAVAEKICAALARPFALGDHVFEISTSIGLAIHPEHGADEQTLTRHADAAMYQAKKNGRSQVVVYQPGMRPQFPRDGQTEWQGLMPS
jgi:diguanylate cyclase (GGDEF)-like protein/PAS domain S-box-containing protein